VVRRHALWRRAQSKAAPVARVTEQDGVAGKLDALLQHAQKLGAP
jgi:hypothetical protein